MALCHVCRETKPLKTPHPNIQKVMQDFLKKDVTQLCDNCEARAVSAVDLYVSHIRGNLPKLPFNLVTKEWSIVADIRTFAR